MKFLKRILSSKLVIAISFFLIGYFTHVTLVSMNHNLHFVSEDSNERIPVDPKDFNPNQGIIDSSDDINVGNFEIEPKRKEDKNFVYYEISIDGVGQENKLNVEIKDGHIHLNYEAKDESAGKHFSSSMEQVFTIDSGLDDKKAEVINQKDKIIIKIPKLKR